ncbi:MAG TPA: hypothetical protein H9717_03800 [Candidatus Eisenbergiella merdipullorum]|uniref:Uncharacterized protein n=1 Tax=Candidatus Eisenbergiella merdipullorum TaxID=2838553 RepID=A0A9D2I4K1_9FIRM|nr:hypothetical protein [Candidatus Eisenbergiella merdipullorum]
MVDQELLNAISDMFDMKLDAKLDAWLGTRFDDIDTKFETVGKRLDAIGRRLDGMDARFDAIGRRLDEMDARFDAIEKRQDRMELRLEKVESDVSALRLGQLEIHKELKRVSARVEDAYNLALEAWGKSTENRNLLEASI